MVKLLTMFRGIKNRSTMWTMSTSRTSKVWHKFRYSRVTKLVSKIKWFHIPVSLLLTLVTYQQYRRILRKKHFSSESENDSLKPYTASGIEVSMYKMLPLRTLSRCWGWINSIELPIIMRKHVLLSYAKTFGCNIEEADIEDLTKYRNLGEFFRRSLKPGLRPIDMSNGVVSPADGTVVYFGRAEDGRVEQVKGITYPLNTFLGPQTWKTYESQHMDYDSDLSEYQNTLLLNKNETELFHCIIYLAPGDYHKFHSPTQWNIEYRRHFPGHLLSVRPTFIRWFPTVFNINERVIYIGKWQYGFFSMAAVGATNVGSVSVYFDDKLETNQWRYIKDGFHDCELEKQVSLDKGDPFGEFKLGSTIVLVFEAPKNIKFDVKPGQKIKYGQLLCKIEE